MLFSFIISIFVGIIDTAYKWLDHNVVANVLSFARGFEFAIILFAAIVFLLISVYITLRKARKLPKSYVIEVADLDGRIICVDGLRQFFSTFEAAESYARFYRQMYRHQYTFRVRGGNKLLASTSDITSPRRHS